MATPPRRWFDGPLFGCLAALLALDGWIVARLGHISGGSGGDAAGNAMSRGFTALIQMGILAVVGTIAIVFLVVRSATIRTGALVALAIVALLVMPLAF